MRRTAAVITTLLVTVLTLIGVADPADAAPVPSPDPSCELQATPTVSGGGITTSVELAFSTDGWNFFAPPAWSYQVKSVDTSAVVAANSFPNNNSQHDTVDTTGWKTGPYTATAEYGDAFPICSATFAVIGVDDEPADEPTDEPEDTPTELPKADAPPTVEIDCGPSQVELGTTITIRGTAYDDHGIATEKIRFPDGTEKLGNTRTWTPSAIGMIAFAYFVVDTGGHDANDLCRVEVVAAAPTPTETPSAPPSNPAPTNNSSSNSSSANATPAANESDNAEDTDNTETADPDSEDPNSDDPDSEDPDAEDTEAEVTGDVDDEDDSELVESDSDDADVDPAEPNEDEAQEEANDDAGLAPVVTDDVPPQADPAQVPAIDTNADALSALTEAIQSAATANEANTQAPTAATDGNGISVPWWFLILIVVLAAYKPVTDLWRMLTQPGRVRAHHNVTVFDS